MFTPYLQSRDSIGICPSVRRGELASMTALSRTRYLKISSTAIIVANVVMWNIIAVTAPLTVPMVLTLEKIPPVKEVHDDLRPEMLYAYLP